jgi:hypothetical protein
MKGHSIRFNLECISVRDVPFGIEAYAYGESFAEALEDLIRIIRFHGGNEGDWFKKYYYTNEDTGYYFYTEEDLAYVEEEEE